MNASLARAVPPFFVLVTAAVTSFLVTSIVHSKSPAHFDERDWAVVTAVTILCFALTPLVSATNAAVASPLVALAIGVARQRPSIDFVQFLLFAALIVAAVLSSRLWLMIPIAIATILALLTTDDFMFSAGVLASAAAAALVGYGARRYPREILAPITLLAAKRARLVGFIVVIFVVIAFYASLYHVAYLCSPDTSFAASGQPYTYTDFVLLSVSILATEGASPAPSTTVTKWLVASEMIVSVLLMVVYFYLLARSIDTN